jgi:thioester reductase-like protein
MSSSIVQNENSTRKALIVGATGLIGNFCLEMLLESPSYSEVTAIVRKTIQPAHNKLKTIISTFDDLEDMLSDVSVDDVFCCLDTTTKTTGSNFL